MCILLSTAAVIPPLSGKRKGVIAGVFIGILLAIVVIAICVIRWYVWFVLQPVTFIIIHFSPFSWAGAQYVQNNFIKIK